MAVDVAPATGSMGPPPDPSPVASMPDSWYVPGLKISSMWLGSPALTTPSPARPAASVAWGRRVTPGSSDATVKTAAATLGGRTGTFTRMSVNSDHASPPPTIRAR